MLLYFTTLVLYSITIGQYGSAQMSFNRVNNRSSLVNPKPCKLYVETLKSSYNLDCGVQCMNIKECYNYQYHSTGNICILCIAANFSVEARYEVSVYEDNDSDSLQEKIWEKTDDEDDCAAVTCDNGCTCVDKDFSYDCLCPEPVCDSSAGNQALSRPTNQSTTYPESYSYKAVDGNLTPYMEPGFMCAHTYDEVEPWWSVSLNGIVRISSVVIINRGDCCAERLANVYVYVSLDSGNPNYSSEKELCNFFQGPGTAGSRYVITCNKPICGRFVILQIRATTDPQATYVLTVCEVEVYS